MYTEVSWKWLEGFDGKRLYNNIIIKYDMIYNLDFVCQLKNVFV